MSSFERAQDYLKLIHRIFDTTPATAPPIIVLANKLDVVANGSTWDTRVVTPDEGKRLADKWTAYSWGLGADSQAAEYHFRRNFFECSIQEAYLVEYALTGAQLPASASAATGETVLPPEAAPHGEWCTTLVWSSTRWCVRSTCGAALWAKAARSTPRARRRGKRREATRTRSVCSCEPLQMAHKIAQINTCFVCNNFTPQQKIKIN